MFTNIYFEERMIIKKRFWFEWSNNDMTFKLDVTPELCFKWGIFIIKIFKNLMLESYVFILKKKIETITFIKGTEKEKKKKRKERNLPNM